MNTRNFANHITTLLAMCLAFAFSARAQNVTMETVPRWPWNGKVDITFTNHDDTPVILSGFQGYDKDHDQVLELRTISYDGEKYIKADNWTAWADARKSCKFVWDAAADYPTLKTSAFTVKATAARGYKYMVVNLTNGSTRFTDTPPDLSDDTCRTTELWLRWVPAGIFTREGHQVTLTQGYFIGVFEVTQKQYELITGDNPSDYKGDTRPVEDVSYDNIRGTGAGAGWPTGGHAVDDGSFLGKLRAKTGLEFDLPTEAQWEYACRAGTTTDFNSGKNLTNKEECPNMAEVGRYKYNQGDGKGGYGPHTKVGCYRPNAWGLYDMHGNVTEWCLDWYGGYPSEAVTDPVGAETGSYRVGRGGGYFSRAQSCRSVSGNLSPPSERFGSIGFRVVCPP